jgi:hypothetical protein
MGRAPKYTTFRIGVRAGDAGKGQDQTRWEKSSGELLQVERCATVRMISTAAKMRQNQVLLRDTDSDQQATGLTKHELHLQGSLNKTHPTYKGVLCYDTCFCSL